MTVHANVPISEVTHKLIEMNKTRIDAILKALSTVMNETVRNKVFTMIKYLNMREYSKDTYFPLNNYNHMIFIFSESNVLHSERC